MGRATGMCVLQHVAPVNARLSQSSPTIPSDQRELLVVRRVPRSLSGLRRLRLACLMLELGWVIAMRTAVVAALLLSVGLSACSGKLYGGKPFFSPDSAYVC